MASTSGFQFKDFVITKSVILRNSVESKYNYDFEIEPSGIIDLKGQSFQLGLDFVLQDEKNSFMLQIESIGFFSFSGDFEEIRPYFLVNAPAIMFPYLRSYISAMTALSGLDTITIPTLNLTSLKEKLEDRITEIGSSKL